jgi:serine/threonine protein kinase
MRPSLSWEPLQATLVQRWSPKVCLQPWPSGAIVPPVQEEESSRTPAVPFGGASPAIRRDLGKYRLFAEIGRGEVAVTYLAVWRGIEGSRKVVVVKELRPALVDADAGVTRFIDEARVAERLTHPNIVQTIEVGADGPRRFMAMEYLDGQTLHQIVQRALKQSNRMSLWMYLGIVVDVLTALEYAHELTDFDGTRLGVVHRNVSPHNVIVTYEGHTKLVDFGTAKSVGTAQEPRAGEPQGKAKYMAPEQAAGAPVDHRADLFAVGVMLWEAVVGSGPWDGQSDATRLRSLISGTVPRVRDAWPDVDPDLSNLVERAMSVDPGARYPTARAMRADLERYIGTRSLAQSSARSLSAWVSRLFAEDRDHRRAIVDAQLRAPTEGTLSGRAPSLPPGGRVTDGPARARETTLASPISGVPSSNTGSSLSLPPPPIVADRRSSHSSPPTLGRARSVAPIIGAAGFGAMLAIVVVMADRFVASEGRRSTAGSAASVPVSVAADDAAPRMAHVIVVASPASAQLFLDDEAVANPYVVDQVRDATAHRIRVEAQGYETKTRVLTFAEDIDLEVTLNHDPPPVPLPPARRAVVPPPPAQLEPTICDPPYVVDSAGKRHWKLECLQPQPLAAAASAEAAYARVSGVQPKPIETGSPYGR